MRGWLWFWLWCRWFGHRWTYEHKRESQRLRARQVGVYRMSEMRPVCARCERRRDGR